MRQGIVLFFFIFLKAQVLFSQSLTSTARWATQKVIVDGNAAEWQDPLNFFDATTRMLFGISNDSTNLYLCFQNPDENVQGKLFRCGLKVSLTVKRKPKRTSSINYPLPGSGDENAGPGQKVDMGYLKTSFRLQNSMMETAGFTSFNGLHAVNDNNLIKASISWNETNRMTYELAIPFTELYGADFTDADLKNELTLHVELLPLPKQRAASGTTSAPVGAAGVMGARAMQGVDMQPNSGSKSPWYKTQEFKQKFVPAIK